MPRPNQCSYTKEHEWVFPEGDIALVGITEFAQSELGDIVFVNMGDSGRTVTAGDTLGEIESVKAVAEVYAPLTGEIVEINPALGESPELLNQDPLETGWLVRIKMADPGQAKGLMDLAAYEQYLKESAH